MLRKMIAGLMACVLIGSCASAEVYAGVTAARSSVAVLNSSEQAPEEVNVVVGQKVTEGEILARQKLTKVFATQDGVVTRVINEAGDTVEGDVLELSPTSKYTVYCTVSEAKSAADNRLVHCGETVYLSCTKNGTHRAVARIYSIDGETYMAETIGGELYVGETVYIYRDTSFSKDTKIGIGTVVESDTEKYTADGCIDQIFVEKGDYVERGQLLYTVAPKDGSTITSPVSGIVAEINADASGKGDSVLATIIPEDEICVEINVSEEQIESIQINDIAYLVYANDPEETVLCGTVEEISYVSQDDSYLVKIMPQVIPERIGMTVEVRVGN